MSIAVYFLILSAFVAIFTREVIAPASRASCDRRWLIWASAINFFQMSAALLAGHFFQASFSGHSLLGWEHAFPDFAAGGITFLVASFVAYWWHRAMHASDTLWRIFHQLHHSPSRIEALTAFYAHPLDSVAATFISCAVAYLVFGFSAAAAAWAILYVGLFNLYIHSDTRSPRWVGLLVQRPEMHRVHHEIGHHAQNYGLPVWDLLFGTWANPRRFVPRCGFEGDRGQNIGDMLVGKDVNA